MKSNSVVKRRSRRGYRPPRRPIVFGVHKDDLLEDKHRVIWAGSGDLNQAEKLGHVRRFKLWPVAKAYAGMKAKQIGATKRKRSDSSTITYTG